MFVICINELALKIMKKKRNDFVANPMIYITYQFSILSSAYGAKFAKLPEKLCVFNLYEPPLNCSSSGPLDPPKKTVLVRLVQTGAQIFDVLTRTPLFNQS